MATSQLSPWQVFDKQMWPPHSFSRGRVEAVGLPCFRLKYCACQGLCTETCRMVPQLAALHAHLHFGATQSANTAPASKIGTNASHCGKTAIF